MLTVDNSNFDNNTAEYGGTIQIHSCGKVNNCTFSNNSAKNGIEVYIKENLE